MTKVNIRDPRKYKPDQVVTVVELIYGDRITEAPLTFEISYV